MSEPASSRAETLRRYIADQEHRWFVLEHPGISAHRLEKARNELAALEAAGVPRTPDSPTHRRGGPARARLEQREHHPPWREPPAVHSVAGLRAHHARVSTGQADPQYVAAATVDGVEGEITYEDGLLTRAVLRGDGQVGDDLTDNVRTIGSVPLRLRPPGTVTESRVTKLTRQALGPSTMTPVPPFAARLRIRVVFALRSRDFGALDRSRVDAGEPPYGSMRGAILGSLARLDPRITAARPLTAFAVGCPELPDRIEGTWQLLGALKSWGFAILPLSWRCQGLGEVLDFVTELQRVAATFEYPLSGGLLTSSRGAFTLGDHDEEALLPRTIRLQFPMSGRPVRVERTFYAMGRGGTVLPYVSLRPEGEPAALAERAPLSVEGVTTFVRVLEGDVIRVRPGGAGSFLLVDPPSGTTLDLDRCPACQEILQSRADEPFPSCPFRGCPGRLKARLLHVVGPRGLGLSAIGPPEVERLVMELGLTDFVGLATIGPERLEAVAPGAGAQFAAALQNLEYLPLWRLIYLLGIPRVGERSARTIAHHVKTVDRLAELTPDEACALPDLSPDVSSGLSRWLTEEGSDALARVRRLPVDVVDDARVFSAPFHGRRVVVAGRLAMGAHHAVEEIERRGGMIQTRVARTTDLLVAGLEAEAATRQAALYDVPTVNERVLETVLQESGATPLGAT